MIRQGLNTSCNFYYDTITFLSSSSISNSVIQLFLLTIIIIIIVIIIIIIIQVLIKIYGLHEFGWKIKQGT